MALVVEVFIMHCLASQPLQDIFPQPWTRAYVPGVCADGDEVICPQARLLDTRSRCEHLLLSRHILVPDIGQAPRKEQGGGLW
jgi:hypothetical protein